MSRRIIGHKRYTFKELDDMPTIHSGQYDNMKIDTGTTRVWLSRMSVEDGMPYNNQVVVEILEAGRWVTAEEYEG